MKATLLCFACLAILVIGCRPRLADRRDISIDVGEIVSIPIDAIGHEQTIKIKVYSPDKPINVHVFLKEDEEAIEEKITTDKPSENLLAHQIGAQQISLEALVPANKEVIVRLQAASPDSIKVHLEITN